MSTATYQAAATTAANTDTVNTAAARPLCRVVGADLPVPIVTGGTLPYANLDYAASAPALAEVAEHIATALPYYASVHRGAGYASQVSTALLENARTCVGSFVDARPDDVVVFVRNTTDALNLLASAVPAGNGVQSGSVLYLDIEHHANLVTWQRQGHVVLEAAPTIRETLRDLDAALAATPTALVAVTGASNVTGELLPIKRIARIAHRHGARVVVDAAQLAPHRRVSLRESGVDYVAFSGHKLYAPYGSGALVGRRDWLDAAPAYLAGGGAVREVTTETTEWAPAPARHEAGTPNVLGAAALAKACEALTAQGEPRLSVHEEALRDRLIAGLARHREVSILRIWADSTDAIGVVAFTVAGFDAGLVAAYLSAEHAIGVRDGRFCAHPLLARLGVGTDGAIRASFGVGSTIADADRLIVAIDQLLATGPTCVYERVDGRYAPVDDPRPLPDFAGPARGPASPCETA
ncbi:MAG TPA: aminotransferase class V-fold PLP-dependent enzyme [Actinocrinis sp.]|nr:aminotransferase class V-fold PLP-dependent enzyme [Actinocrinis sp.]